MTILVLLIAYRNVKDTEMKRWIISTLRYLFVLCIGERHRENSGAGIAGVSHCIHHFCMGPGDQTQVSRRSLKWVLLFTAPHSLLLLFYKIFLVILYNCACDFFWWKYSKLRCYINHVVQWNNFLCSELMRIIYKLHKEFELNQFVLEDHFTINRITF